MHRRNYPLFLTFPMLTILLALSATDRVLAARDSGQEPTPASTVPQQIVAAQHSVYPSLPVYFETNVGQFDDRVRYASRTRGVNVFLTDSEAVLVVKTGTTGKQRFPRSVSMSVVNGSADTHVSAVDKLPGRVNYFYGNKSEHWHTDVPIYAKVKYGDVYPGIDLLFRSAGQRLEFDFVLAPGAEPSRIALAVKGSDTVNIDPSGDVILGIGKDRLRLHRPRIYQRDGSHTRDIPGSFSKDANGHLRFQVAAYDRSLPLVIDPVVSYSSYLGGGTSGEETMGTAIAVHSGGSAYVTGYTTTADFPVTPGVFQPDKAMANSSDFEGFVARVSDNGGQLVYASYLGGEGQDIPMSIAVDATGNAYVTGKTQSDDFPITSGAYQETNCGSCAFLTKITPNGATIVYSTYLGSTLTEARAVALDTVGNAYLIGHTSSSSFPTTEGVVQPNRGGGFDAFVSKVNNTGTALLYSTRLGGSGDELLSSLTGDIAVDIEGNAYVTGQTDSVDFPTVNALQPQFGSDQTQDDAFVAKLNAEATALVYSTYLGGSKEDRGQGIDVDADGNAYVVGKTTSSDFPISNALQPDFAGPDAFGDAFLSKLSADGTALVYSTFLGGADNVDEAFGVAVNASEQPHIVGQSLSSDFPTLDPIDGQPVSSSAVFVSKLLADGSGFVYSSRFGGGVARGMDIALDAEGSAYFTGSTGEDNFPVVNAFQPSAGEAAENAFITKFADPLTLRTTPVDLSGTVQDPGGTGLCAMVLASGQFMFSCNPNGPYSLTDLPRETDGTVKRQIYVDGFFPEIDVLPDSVEETVVMTRAGTCPDYNSFPQPGVFPGSAGKRIDISGSVLLQDSPTPICAMVLANGQFMFSCDSSGSYALNIPLDANGQFKLQVYADGFAPTIQTFDEFNADNDVRMARASECQ